MCIYSLSLSLCIYIYIYIWVSHNILITKGTIWQLRILLPKSWRWRNHIRLWDDKLTWYSLSISRWICLYSLEPKWTLPDWWDSCDQSEISTTIWLLYCDQRPFPFHTTNISVCFCGGVMAEFEFVSISSRIRLCYTFIGVAVKSHTE